MKKAFDRVRVENSAGDEFLDSLRVSEKLYDLIQKQNRPQYLLHGDLHHENIVKSGNDKWKVIDPQGRIGEKVLEVGRFFINEWDLHDKNVVSGYMEKLINTFSKVTGEEEWLVAASCFLDCTLSTCWSLEDCGSYEKLDGALAKIRWLRRYL